MVLLTNKRNLKDELPMHLITLMTIAGVSASGSIYLNQTLDKWIGGGIMLVFFLIYFFPPINRFVSRLERLVYVFIQMSLIGFLLILSKGQSIVFAILFFILASQLANFYEKRTGFLLIGLICLEIALIFWWFHGFDPILTDLLPLFAGFFFFGGFTYSWVEAQTVKKEAQMLKKIEEIRLASLLDPLTGAGNREFTRISLEKSLEVFHKEGLRFGVLFFDIDHFKKINDQFGHMAGDRVLKGIGKALLSNTRAYDFVGRWGGEEFIIILVNVTEDVLRKIAEDLRSLVENIRFDEQGGVISVTVSIGGTIVQEGDDMAAIVARADHLMYTSKSAGRNCVTIG